MRTAHCLKRFFESCLSGGRTCMVQERLHANLYLIVKNISLRKETTG